ncbi:NrtA/SsuA/CpmA family ABC transporter substrate-binding protein [Pseudactinotalea terrae]|uniref:NrtA/SsuA/CpmA family ABC transporter substrate-binding protein n=1 Tax=Pseudactinotalea terrae TaxID=1743262 RepID=UPI0012E32B61|nr:NrtA/SsuA/CpmA family ABC transporter substrate-binding protein [Pseudactinotalea terrae]
MPALLRPAALLATAVLTLVACATPDDATGVAELRAGPLNTQNTLTLATASGHLEEAVTEGGGTLHIAASFPAFAPAAEAMAADQIDMTTGSSTSLISALQGNPDLVVFAVEVNDNDTQGIVAAPATGITSVGDLSGRTVAINEGGTGDYLLRTALARAGMDIEDVEPVHLAPPEAATAFAGGQVDAWATWDQYLVAAQDIDGATLVAMAADVGATNPTVHVVTRDFLTNHPELVRAAYDALTEQAESVIAHPELLAEAYREDGAAPEVAQAIAAKTPPRIVPADEDFTEQLQDVAEFYAEQGLITSTTDVSEAVVDVRELP